MFGKLLNAGVDLVTSPIEAVKDVATIGGLLTKKDESYSSERLKKLIKEAEELLDGEDD